MGKLITVVEVISISIHFDNVRRKSVAGPSGWRMLIGRATCSILTYQESIVIKMVIIIGL